MTTVTGISASSAPALGAGDHAIDALNVTQAFREGERHNRIQVEAALDQKTVEFLVRRRISLKPGIGVRGL
ncbi:hypothetical protein [Microvirga ossetica]|uniref:hypothetical protein n=1 Tax=Microvirga ossetica TaxID=1882682 RepID=UPI001F3DB86B|nr:hypothetical protein [Microvirga ossetica]